MFILIITRGNTKMGEFLLGNGVATIGRKPDNDVCIPEPTVSGCHARIVAGGESVRIEDLGSTNGTYLNGRRIKEQVLAAGDVIIVGKHKLICASTDAADAGPFPEQTVELSRQELDELLAALDGDAAPAGASPSRIAWLAQDAEGTWWGFAHKPLRGETGWDKTGTYSVRLKQGAHNPDWHHTLRKV